MTISLDLGLTKDIIEVCRIRDWSLNDTAYALATTYWETGKTMMPVKEAFYLGKKAEAYRKKLRYYPWYGRGLVQLTWKDNYIKAGKRLGADFISDPDKVMDPFYTVRILVIGMEEGWFTGKSVGDYIDDIDESDEEDRKEYEEARRVINGVDKKKEIAALALEYEKKLKEWGYKPGGITLAPAPIPAPVGPVEAPQKASNWLTLLIAFIRAIFNVKR